MSSPTNAATDKALAPLLSRIERAMKAVDEALRTFGNSKYRAAAAAEVAQLKKRIDTAQREPLPAAQRALTQLLKAAEALAPELQKRCLAMYALERREQLRGELQAALAGALLEIGRIADPVATKLVFAEQAQLKARLDKAERLRGDAEAVNEMDDIDDAVTALQPRIKLAHQIATDGRALDKELQRVGRLLREVGSPQDLAGWLKKLVQIRTTVHTKARNLDELKRLMAPFGKDLGELAATLRREALRAAAH